MRLRQILSVVSRTHPAFRSGKRFAPQHEAAQQDVPTATVIVLNSTTKCSRCKGELTAVGVDYCHETWSSDRSTVVPGCGARFVRLTTPAYLAPLNDNVLRDWAKLPMISWDQYLIHKKGSEFGTPRSGVPTPWNPDLPGLDWDGGPTGN